MDMVMAHIQERWMGYAGILLCAGPLVYLFRRQVLPVIWYALEIAVYIAMFHLLVYGVVRLGRWFKYESTFMQEKADTGWQTPLFAIWDREVYNPNWLFYLEVVAVILIVVGVFRFRPFRAQKLTQKSPPPRKGMASQVRPGLPSRSGVRR